MSNITKIENSILEQRQSFNTVLCDQQINFDREAGFALQIITGNNYLASVALNNPQSLKNAINNVAAIGITLNPASKLAYLVPRKQAICLDISYMGLLHLAQLSGAILWGQARVVREGEHFLLKGIDQPPEHELDPFKKEPGEIIGAYSVAKTPEGDYLTHCMSIAEIYAIRARSEAWKAYVKDNSKLCPWNTDLVEMIKKTTVKPAAKMWPRRERLDNAVHYLNTDGDEGIDFRAQERDVTPSTEQQHAQIIDSLIVLDRKEAAFLDYCRATFKRDEINTIQDLTNKEAAQAISAMSAAVKKATAQ